MREATKKWLYKIRNQAISYLIKPAMTLLVRTCKITVEGLEQFHEIAQKEKCILVLWHNRLAVVPAILYRYTPQFNYAALVSGSRDGEILSKVVQGYKQGRVIKASHHSRYKALRELVQHIEQKESVVVITPDGPRGPRYELKPGVALAAIETESYIVGLEWKTEKFWELKTWDRMRIPKPFSKITVRFLPAICFPNHHNISLEEAQHKLKEYLPF